MINLNEIKDPLFLKDLTKEELVVLAKDIRTFLIESLSKTGGHLSSNLGVVELTIALHRVFDSPNDKLIFDRSIFQILFSICLSALFSKISVELLLFIQNPVIFLDFNCPFSIKSLISISSLSFSFSVLINWLIVFGLL